MLAVIQRPGTKLRCRSPGIREKNNGYKLSQIRLLDDILGITDYKLE